jgi:hypothetical protein
MSTQLRDREALMGVMREGKEVLLRMRVVGMDVATGEMEVVHAPVFGGEKGQVGAGKVQEGRKASEEPSIIRVRLTGIEYPMIERCVKEL